MNKGYDETIEFWDNIFEQDPEPNPTKPVNQEIEDGISWLAENTYSTIDFGCGNGTVMFRCLEKGMNYVYGIDISESAIKLANNVIDKFNYRDRAEVVYGGIEKLSEINDNSFESGILFNIIDNLIPEDSIELIKNIHRIIIPNGKLLLKLNPYIIKEKREKYKFIEISDEFYKEDSGLYLWNLTNQMFEEVIEPFFTIEKYEEIEFKQYNMINRMYCLRNKQKTLHELTDSK